MNASNGRSAVHQHQHSPAAVPIDQQWPMKPSYCVHQICQLMQQQLFFYVYGLLQYYLKASIDIAPAAATN
jgi:hypothetical protein